jgi:hypothetical protein
MNLMRMNKQSDAGEFSRPLVKGDYRDGKKRGFIRVKLCVLLLCAAGIGSGLRLPR